MRTLRAITLILTLGLSSIPLFCTSDFALLSKNAPLYRNGKISFAQVRLAAELISNINSHSIRKIPFSFDKKSKKLQKNSSQIGVYRDNDRNLVITGHFVNTKKQLKTLSISLKPTKITIRLVMDDNGNASQALVRSEEASFTTLSRFKFDSGGRLTFFVRRPQGKVKRSYFNYYYNSVHSDRLKEVRMSSNDVRVSQKLYSPRGRLTESILYWGNATTPKVYVKHYYSRIETSYFTHKGYISAKKIMYNRLGPKTYALIKYKGSAGRVVQKKFYKNNEVYQISNYDRKGRTNSVRIPSLKMIRAYYYGFHPFGKRDLCLKDRTKKRFCLQSTDFS